MHNTVDGTTVWKKKTKVLLAYDPDTNLAKFCPHVADLIVQATFCSARTHCAVLQDVTCNTKKSVILASYDFCFILGRGVFLLSTKLGSVFFVFPS